nr:WYL domain-containing protein [uncultured Rikenella sp.]
MNDHPVFAELIDAMRKWTVIEFIYRTKENHESYSCVAPFGLKEIGGRWYLFGFDREDHLHIFDIANRTEDPELFWATFSVPEMLDFGRFAERYFTPERVK